MKVRLDAAAAGALRSLPPVAKRRMKEALGRLASNPTGRVAGMDVRRLDTKARWPTFRLAIGDWRAAWVIRGDSIEVVRIFHRSEGYGWLERLYP